MHWEFKLVSNTTEWNYYYRSHDIEEESETCLPQVTHAPVGGVCGVVVVQSLSRPPFAGLYLKSYAPGIII